MQIATRHTPPTWRGGGGPMWLQGRMNALGFGTVAIVVSLTAEVAAASTSDATGRPTVRGSCRRHVGCRCGSAIRPCRMVGWRSLRSVTPWPGALRGVDGARFAVGGAVWFQLLARRSSSSAAGRGGAGPACRSSPRPPCRRGPAGAAGRGRSGADGAIRGGHNHARVRGLRATTADRTVGERPGIR